MKMQNHAVRRVLVASLFLSIVALIAWLAFRWTMQLECEELQREAKADLAIVSQALLARMEKTEHLPGVAAGHPAVADALLKSHAQAVEKAEAFLATLPLHMQTGTQTDTIFIMDMRGVVIASNDRGKADSLLGQNLAARPFFQEALRHRTGRLHEISAGSLRPEYTKAQVVMADERAIGVAAVRVDLSRLDQDWGQGRKLFVVTDENGIAFLASRPDWKYRSFEPVLPALAERLKHMPRYGNALKAPMRIDFIETLSREARTLRIAAPTAPSERFLAHAAPLADTHWGMQVFIPLQAAYGKALSNMAAAAAVCCLALISPVFLKRRSRLQQALRHARQALEGRRKELKAMEADMISGAIIDRLTGAYTHRLFQEMAEKLMSASKHHRRPFSLVVIGPDYIRQTKERYGAAASDKVLMAVAATCKRTLRGQDIFARYEEERFVLAMPDTDAGAALIAGERFRKAISAQEIRTDIGNAISITVSIGVTQILGKEDTVRDMISRADAALLTAMNGGRNQVMVS